MKQAFRLSRVGAALSAFVLIASAFVSAQTVSPSPDTFVTQITTTTIAAVPTPTPSPVPSPAVSPTPINRDSYVTDLSGNGRFAVIESNGDIATEKTAARNNADGNQEIFLFDYAQRRIFQITNTKNALKDQAGSPIDPTNIDVQIVNLKPRISHDGRYIVFESNAYSDANAALSPFNFDGNANSAALKLDGNTEIFLYTIPVAPDVDLTSGAEVAAVNLVANTMQRITNTPAASLPRAGSSTFSPFFADDNYSPAINDDASYIIFISTRNIAPAGTVNNTDGNPEVFIYNRNTAAFTQVTNTRDIAPSSTTAFTPVFSENPQLSGSGNTLAFISDGDINSTETDANKRNAEIYVATYNGTTVSNLRPVTSTPPETRAGIEGSSVNALSPGRRLSRDGNLLAFESTADFNANGSLNGALKDTPGIYVYNVAANTFTLVVGRPTGTEPADIALRFPTFTGDNSRIVFASDLNLKTDGTIAASGSADGLNAGRSTQIFSALYNQSGATASSFSRLSSQPTVFAALQPIPSDTIRRNVFSLRGTELGGGNADGLTEAFYLFIPPQTSEVPAPSPTPAASPAPVSFSTGASDRPVVAASPTPTPPAVTGLAPGELGILRSTLVLANTSQQVDKNSAREDQRRPTLPVELAGVSVSISSAAAGLYFVSPGQINFVVPPGLLTTATTALPVVINNNGAVTRTSLLVNAAQPDIFTTTNGAGGRAAVLNVTNPCISPTGEPFSVTTTVPKDSKTTGVCTVTGTDTVPTELLIMLTGVRSIGRTAYTVRIGTTDLTGDAILSAGPSLTTGFDQVVVRLPATLAAAGDVPVIVTVTISGVTYTSRAADTAPHITIQ